MLTDSRSSFSTGKGRTSEIEFMATAADYETLLAELCALQLADRDYPDDLKPDNSQELKAHAARLARRAEIVAALLQIVNSKNREAIP